MGAVQQESFPISRSARDFIRRRRPQQKQPKIDLDCCAWPVRWTGARRGSGSSPGHHGPCFPYRRPGRGDAAYALPFAGSAVKEVEPKQLPRELQQAEHGIRDNGLSHVIPGCSGLRPKCRCRALPKLIRSIKLAVDLNVTDTSNKVVGITSSLPNEGKSTIAASLALLMAHAGARVIVVDCDLRNPSLSRSLAPTANVGLIEVIGGRISLEDAIWRDPKTNLAFCCRPSRTSPLFHSSEILSAAATRQLFDNLRADLRLCRRRPSAAGARCRCASDRAADRLLHSGGRMGMHQDGRRPACPPYGPQPT